ncbi:hypothetical protein RB195_016174 [Necator americanus]|uniref:Bestrophin homolog n=1 Tax=Necator americanus TaxID=51031 RepID=A0ABR1E852_NECAM
MPSHSNFRTAFSRVAVNILGCFTLSDPSLHVSDDILVEWRNSCRKVTVQLSKYLYVLSRYALVVRGFYESFRLNPTRLVTTLIAMGL